MTNKLHADAAARFESLPFPTNADEHWRFANLVFWGKEIANKLALPCEKSCAFATLEDESSKRFYASLLNGGKFDAMAAAAFCSRKLIVVGAGQKLKIDEFESAANIVVLEDGAELEVLRARNFSGGNLYLEANCFYLGRGSKLNINTHFTSDADSPRYSRNDFYLQEGANVRDVFVESGNSNTRAERNFYLEGANARAEIYALLSSADGITHDFCSSQIHLAQGAHSNLKIKNILADKSRSAFMGLIRVEEGAQKTEAYQSCRSLLLSPSARASASPILEIMANDVACSHGCAVARPDKEQLFYMKSRGIDERSANALLITGFANEIFEKFSDEIFAERVAESVLK